MDKLRKKYHAVNSGREVAVKPLTALAFAKVCIRLFSLCAERDFAVCNFYLSAFSEILLRVTKS